MKQMGKRLPEAALMWPRVMVTAPLIMLKECSMPAMAPIEASKDHTVRNVGYGCEVVLG